ncbi:hypothetical protein PHYBLDRAFT_167176 [Phycomyces blakesleeanus NRRL 1555(-)]|uniref:DDE Tnp4 domain-containing protein n=1 Tax=Phycomyces blakesleeanus (strain ATCC 8743b / DSM 1359 / FGSC 10004 / NBRC 33097 / NRRL 1555) TaxID=763407 RepID=A0A162XH14_PHYB8|nr:hypothetical protein PHYBLDRAFT_167176 [Phycomyces blakesleeanus NRRL 1555(-)]OAD74835.1 hypothetical protein PHYBLDRAFT_167176 [Phycomyces blakesleeanus NRRL 1555(-)]|eukprot:XP_018292875.1 hypothetical protein PHYBLDRAFT_167176 [Phycomyces blakesleeanus NRRL 1555(-)]
MLVGALAKIVCMLDVKANRSKQRNKKKKLARIDLEALSDDTCKKEFRFTLSEIKAMCATMNLPLYLEFKHSKSYTVRVEREFAFALVLYWYTFPQKYTTMKSVWGMSAKTLGLIVNKFTELLRNKFKNELEFDTRQFSSENCKTFPNVVGFVDGTMQKVSRPSSYEDQKLIYNGWKHIHCIKYQAIATPNGITSSLVGPFIGSTHDARIFDESKTLDCLIVHLDHISKDDNVLFKYVVYRDMAYPKSDKVYKPFPLSEANNDKLKKINKSIRKTRIQVEIEFGKVSQLFKFCKYNYGIKIFANTKPATIYILSNLFKNFHMCIKGSAGSKLFKLQPPNIHDYIKGLMHEYQPEDTIDNYKTILNNASNLVETVTVPDN